MMEGEDNDGGDNEGGRKRSLYCNVCIAQMSIPCTALFVRLPPL